jgi:signal transduction histidine kinase
MKSPLKLRTILVGLNLVVFLLPLVGFAGLRVYDTQLVRQTQAELVAQGAVIAAAYKQALHDAPADYGTPLALPHDETPTMAKIELDTTFDRVLPRAPEALPTDLAADARALDAGQAIAPLVQQTKAATLAGIRVVDPRGIVVATSGTELFQSLAHREEVALALKGEVASGLRERVASDPNPAPLASLSRNTGWRVFVALPVIEGDRLLAAVVLSRTPMTLGKALWNDRYYLASIIAVMLAVVLFVSLLGTWLLARPVEQLTAFSEHVARGGEIKDAPQVKRPAELVTLANAFAHMAEALEVRASYIKTFAAAVSHEFKTPLTSMRGAVELLADHMDTMPAEQRQKFIAQIGADTERLDRLVRRLLELARADVAEPDRSVTDVRAVLEAIAAAKRTPDVQVEVTGAAATAQIGRETLETVVSNLLDNAVQHGGRPLHVTLVLEAIGERVVLRVRDDGPGISAGNAARIFQPFFTTSRERGGTGLGLNIVKTLVEARGGSIAHEPSDRGACFRIELARADDAVPRA